MKLKILFLFLLASVCGWGQGTENFANIPTNSPSNYDSRSWTGTDGVTWTATNARTDQTLTLKAICTNNIGSVTSPSYNGGMGTLSFNYVRAFTGTGSRSIEVWINGVQIGSTITVSPTSNTIANYSQQINISGNVVLELRTSGAQIKIDDISWTGFAACTAPTNQATNFTSTVTGQTTATIGWTRGNGNNVLVVARAGGAVNADPTSGTAYTANPAFGSGQTTGTGNYVVYNGNGTSVNLTGLTAGTNYHFAVYEYNDTDTCYNTTELTGNLTTQSAPQLTIAGSLTENTTLNGGVVSLTLNHETFADGSLNAANFTLNNAPAGVSINSVSYVNTTSATLTLAYDGTDFDTNFTNFNITINGSELTSTENLTSNNLTINAQTETLSVNTGTLAFGTVCFGNSADGTFTISGSNLKEGTINLSPLTGYVYSESLGGTAITSFPNVAGSFTNKTIHVRFTPTAQNQTYIGNITVSSLTTNTVNKAVTGNSTVTSPTITTNTANLVVNTTANLRGNYGNAGSCYTIIEKGFIYARTSDNSNPTNGDVNGTTVFKVPVAGVATGAYNSPLSGLSPSTSYTYVAYVTDGTNYFYGITITFTTLGTATNLVFNPVPPATGGVGINLTSFSVSARRADNSVDTEYTGAITLSKASGPGNMNGTLTVNAVLGVAAFNNISFDDAGTYTIQAASGSLPSITSGNIVISFISSYTDYFQSRQSGDWTNVNSWESSPSGQSGTWINATLYPGEGATSVIVRAEDVININTSGIKIANTDVYGQLEIEDIDFQLMGTGHALKIKEGAELILDGSGKPTTASTGTALIETGGNFKVVSFSGANNLVSNYLHVGSSSNKFKFENHSIFEWSNNNTLGSSNFEEIFDVVNLGDFVIFRLTQTFSPSNYGSGTNNSFNAVLELPGNRTLSLQGNGNKTFRGGIQGTGILSVTYNSGSGKLIFGHTTGASTLGDSGNLTLRVPNSVLQFQNIQVPSTAQVTIESNDNIQNRTVERIGGNININGTLDITNMRVNNSATGSIIVNNGGKIRTRNTAGLFGAGTAIQDYELSKLVFNSGSTVEYYGTVNQTVSNGLEYSNLEITGTGIKTGATGNVIVNQITKINDGAKFHIAETADNVVPNVLTAKGGINVSSATGTELVLQNNAVLMQNTGVTNTGNITQLRKANVPWNQYNYWASPVADQVLYSLYDNGLVVPTDRVMVYNPETDYFKIKYKSTNPTSKFGEGYSIKGPASNPSEEVTAKFIGTPNNESSISTENQITVATFDNDDNFNLIGNPFPSNLDLDLLYGENEEVFVDITDEGTPGFYFWDNVGNTAYTQQGPDYDDYYQNNYAVYNPVFSGGTAAAAGPYASNKKPNGIVKPGQGFIINVKQGQTSLTVNNNMRTTDIMRGTDQAVYYKNGNNLTASDEVERNDKFWLELVNPVNGKNQTAIGYFQQAVDTFDNYDSKVLDENVSDNIYTLSKDAVKLAIQGREGNFKNTDVIPLGVKFFVNGKYKIQLEETKGIFVSHQAVYLKDKLLGRIHNLSADGPYEIDGVAGEYNDRYEIVFKDGSTPSGPVLTTATQNKINILKRDNQIEINSSRDKITEVEIFDLAGWPVYKNNQVNSKIISIPALSFKNQIIVVKVQTETGEIQTKKFVNQ